jgi:tRNA (guanine37-N1)-methyltransferase
MAFSAQILTLFPEMFPGPLGFSLAGRALGRGLWSLETLNIRDFATDRHRTVDDTPYGGGAGMVLRPDIVDTAVRKAQANRPGSRLVYFTPRGTPFTQAMAQNLCTQSLILLCGRFEGVDERVLEAHEATEICIGDYVLSGGEIAAFSLLDACIRLIPGVMGGEASATEESFGFTDDFSGLLEYPHYTKPPIWNSRTVPDVLLSGNHAEIRNWRLREAKKTTKTRRPDLWAKRSDADLK